MARTRSKGGAASTSADKTASTTTKAASTSAYTLPAESTNPPKLLVLPKDASSSARIITLENPRYGKPTRYLICPETGSFYEFTKVAPPNKSTPRSWLLSSTEKESALESQTIQSPELYLATPYDPIFLLIPALFKPSSSSKSEKQERQYLSLDDYLDLVPNTDRHFSEILTLPDSKVEKALEARLAVVCDCVEMGDDKMYRPNDSKLSAVILSKARKMAEKLPPSMEEKFIKKALEAPVMGIVKDQQPTAPPPAAGSPEDSASPSETRSTTGTTPSVVSTAATTPATEAAEPTFAPAIVASPAIVTLQRLRTGLNFILSSYLPPSLSRTLQSSLPSETFAPLEEYLSKLSKLRAEAAASRSNDINGGKRSRDEEDDERLEKKRKMEQEEKVKKANTSRGVKQLAKVNTSGMMKLSSFFKKKT
ncbi:putative ribonuclease [Triangularia verruculosa]|uniref:Ribonuclease H2 subunit B n=1 Tax=Triangularia verruculosa TaxID=2587418 RepID=A0AAN6XD90_9PEZI|nr:putative ribonuclease [Triangularia verruculosa]